METIDIVAGPVAEPVTLNDVKLELGFGPMQSLARMGFNSLVIARPSLIEGDRAALGQSDRPGEGVGILLARGLRPLLPANYRAILARDVAHALLRSVHAGLPGVTTLLSGQMQGGRSAPANRQQAPMKRVPFNPGQPQRSQQGVNNMHNFR